MIVLVLGGAGSGKSRAAERLAASLPPPLTYVATWTRRPGTAPDPDMEARVAAHRARRPPSWRSLEAGEDLAGAFEGVTGTVLIDALGTWVAGHDGRAPDVDGLCRALRGRSGDTVVVSDEVGLGVHPSTPVGRRYRDVLGAVNQTVAEVADQAWLVVAGRVVSLARPPWADR